MNESVKFTKQELELINTALEEAVGTGDCTDYGVTVEELLALHDKVDALMDNCEV